MRAISSVLVMAAASVATAGPVTLGFTRISSNAPADIAPQLSAEVSEVAGNPARVSFMFRNTAVIPSSLSEVYYDSRGASPLVTLVNPFVQLGASFAAGSANPGNLPGGNGLANPFSAVGSFSADANGNPRNGLDASIDYLMMSFDLAPGADFDDVIAALQSGDLRVGVRVRAISPDGNGDFSDAFVGNNPPRVIIPLPTAAATAALGLAAVGFRRRR